MQLFEEELKVQPHLKVSDVPERSSDSPTEGSQSSAELSRSGSSPFLLR